MSFTSKSELNIAPDEAYSEIYFNGISIALTLSDMNVTLSTDGRAMCKLRMSFTTAKTLSEQLSAAVAEFEKLAAHEIMTMTDVEEKVKAIYDKE